MKINSLRALEKFDLKKVLRNQVDARTLYKEQIVLLSDEIKLKAKREDREGVKVRNVRKASPEKLNATLTKERVEIEQF